MFITRFAPSPTGLAHCGNFRTALFNFLAASASEGKFYLRIDDTDSARSDDAYVDVIMDAMSWLGLNYDACYRQSDRMDLYRSMADKLISNGSAYYDRDRDGPDAPLRMKVPDNLPMTWVDDLSGTIKVSDTDRKIMDGLVLLRSDGSPTYHFSSVVDDVDMGINLIIRGTDHINNTPKQIAIMAALGADIPRFAHVGLIDHKDPVTGVRKKLSKRDDAASLLKYRDAGYDPRAILNFLLRLGWSPSDANFDKKVKMVSLDDAIDMFLRDGRMRAAPSLLDPSYLDVIDRRWKALEKAA